MMIEDDAQESIAVCAKGRLRGTELTELYRQYAPMIYHICLRFVRDRQKAQDLRGEILIKVVKGLDGFRGDSSLGTWITTITERHLVDYVRKRPKTSFLVAESKVSYVPEPSEAAEAEGILCRQDIQTCMQYCQPMMRMVVQLYFLEGYTQLEVARLLGYRRTAINKLLRGFAHRVQQENLRQAFAINTFKG